MISVTRHRQIPPSLDSAAAREAKDEATQFIARNRDMRTQELFNFDAAVYAAADVMSMLRELFHDKCAFCETPAAMQPLTVTHFRPPGGLATDSGQFLPLHYAWL